MFNLPEALIAIETEIKNQKRAINSTKTPHRLW
jgi:hypothetical protein